MPPRLAHDPSAVPPVHTRTATSVAAAPGEG